MIGSFSWFQLKEDGRKLSEGLVEKSKRKLTWTANDTVTFKMFHSSVCM